MTSEIHKKLSANDLGETGSHQAGILVPKDEKILSFFPRLDPSVKNPRTQLVVRERDSGTRWQFNFIYYNGRLFGGTRNEYRLTCMSKYLRLSCAKVGDDLRLSRDDDQSFVVAIKHAAGEVGNESKDGVLVLSGGWKIIKY